MNLIKMQRTDVCLFVSAKPLASSISDIAYCTHFFRDGLNHVVLDVTMIDELTH